MATETGADQIPGMAEAISALQDPNGLGSGWHCPPEGAERIARIVLAAATPAILSAAFADTADDLRDMPGLRTVGQAIDLLEHMSHHIREITK